MATAPLQSHGPKTADDNSRVATEVTARLAAVRVLIETNAEAVGRDPRDVTIVAVSKLQPLARVRAALEAGHRIFGENRVQEAATRWPALRRDYAGIELHLVGPLQTNKTREAVALFDTIETLDRVKLADALARERDRRGAAAPFPKLFIQVNTGEEPQKAGVWPDDLEKLFAHARALDLPVVGLMCIPPVDEEPSLHFALLEKMARELGLSFLSMGMSNDADVAVRFGATHVRVGTAIFGPRESRGG